VSTLLLDLQAALTAAVLHQILQGAEAAASLMAYLLASVPTRQLKFADLTAVWCAFVAQQIRHEFLAAVAEPSHALETWWAVTRVARH